MNTLYRFLYGTACGMAGFYSIGAYASEPNAPEKSRQDRPNILWLTFEDTSSREFGCYGHPGVSTPHADSLAAHGVQFMSAWSAAPQSSAARSGLITGCYATTYGMDVHPVPYPTPEDIFFPQRLREAGYYCTNNNKTHYNSTSDNKACWDECGKKASYNSPARDKDQPFFAVFNCVASHMACARTFHTYGRRDYLKEGIDMNALEIPPYIPDLPEVRSDYAAHLESVQDIDEWAGFFLKDLRDRGLDENTIIFFFSDHGGCIARGKGYLYESGLRVPLIAYFPQKWEHLRGELQGKVYDLVNFTDLGPTVLSLAGVKPEGRMQGKAIFGKYASAKKRDMQFAVAANQLHHYMPVRAVTDGRYKLIRSYIPYRQFALRNYYQWGMPSNQAWDEFVLRGKNDNPTYALPFLAHPAEMLFDLENDPGEIHDISQKPEYKDILERLGKGLSEHIRSTADLGFFLPTSRTGHILYNKVREEGYPLEELYTLVETAGMAEQEDLPLLEKALESSLDEMRFWAVVGYATLASNGKLHRCPDAVLALMDDENPYIGAEAAYAAVYAGKEKEGMASLVRHALQKDGKIYYSSLECISLDPEMHRHFRPHIGTLMHEAETRPRIQNEDTGLMVRGILANLGKMEIRDIYGPESYEKGLKLNSGRRKQVPLP